MQRRTMGSIITGGLLAAMLMVTWSGNAAAQTKPTIKRPVRQPSLSVVDHYRCYKVDPHGRHTPRKVGLKDQFQSGSREVGPITSICAPVLKDHNGKITKPRYPQVHLVCYAVRPGKRSGPDVRTSNQFGRASMTVAAEETLCVPSFKRVTKK